MSLILKKREMVTDVIVQKLENLFQREALYHQETKLFHEAASLYSEFAELFHALNYKVEGSVATAGDFDAKHAAALFDSCQQLDGKIDSLFERISAVDRKIVAQLNTRDITLRKY